ncbi:MAG: serpin family protein [archaeon]|nr:serpin family protein [archaeon]
MKKKVLAVLLSALFLAGCASPNPEPNPNNTAALVDDSGYALGQEEELIGGINQFAFDFYGEVNAKDNVFISPWSASSALGMTYEGAREKTAEEMAQVLGLPANDARRRSSFAHLIKEINAPNEHYNLSTANAIWINQEFQIEDSFSNVARSYYDAQSSEVDFSRNIEAASEINSWVEEKTNNKIKDLVPPSALNSLTRIVLTNAVYFKGTWKIQFDPNNTKKEVFHSPSGEVMADMMIITKNDKGFNYAEDGLAQVLELPYNGDKISMLIILPKGDISELEASLDAAKVAEYRNSLRNREFPIYIPKFKFEKSYSLKQALSNLGMQSAFAPGVADFSGISKGEDLYISEALQKTFVEVNEEGTEAAAVTAVVAIAESAEIQIPLEFKADHPFIFLIQDRETGLILFLGKITDPTK